MNLKDKVIAFDLDGTLVGSDGNISEYSANVIKQLIEEGYCITLITGRNIVSGAGTYHLAGMKGPAVFCNGSIVKDPDKGPYIFRNTIPLDVINYYSHHEEINELIDDMMVEIEYKTYAKTGKIFKNSTFIGDFENNLTEEPSSMVFYAKDEKSNERIREIVNTSSTYHYRYWGKLGEFYTLLVDKKTGAEKLLEYYGKTQDDLIFFGDAENDRLCLSYAGVGVAMANADEYTKAVANLVTDYPNWEDGAVKFLLKMIEESKQWK